MEKHIFFSKATSIFFLSVISVSVAARQYGVCPHPEQTDGDCEFHEFKCLDGRKCVMRSSYCNYGIPDCWDSSDENFCSYDHSGCPKNFTECKDSLMCIPAEWNCDGHEDCPDGYDEQCNDDNPVKRYPIHYGKLEAIKWLFNMSVNASTTRKWGPFVHKLAVAFYLSDPRFLSNDSTVRKEITYELGIQLLSRINKKTIQGVSSNDLASFINALIVTCTDPTDFHGFNLVQELRSRVDKQNYTVPYLFLALCNGGDTITDSDARKLTETFWSNNREIWTATQAIVLMALSCARNQMDSTIDAESISELALALKQQQYRNGTVGNLHTTLLVMQALYAAESDEDPNNFDERKALSYILKSQSPDGSFGNMLLTYYALPVLNCKSMVDISSAHCQTVPKDEGTAAYDLVSHVGPKMRIRYSVWFGMEKDIERSLTLRVPTNTSFYGIMEIAAEIDHRYRFDYTVRKRKPYITAVSGTLDNPESEQFWFPHIMKDGKPSLIQKSTADVIPKHQDHIIMWYRKGSWVE